MGYSPQKLILFENMRTVENFRLFGKGMRLIDNEIQTQGSEIMKKLNFSNYANTLVKNLDRETRQKVNLGISLLGDPQILVLDVLYQGMDYGSFKSFWDIQFDLRKQGKAVIIVSHMIEDQSKFSKSLHLILYYKILDHLMGIQKDFKKVQMKLELKLSIYLILLWL